jgi:hypothetical protein
MEDLNDTLPTVTLPEIASSSPPPTTTREVTSMAEREDIFRFLDLPAGKIICCGHSYTLTQFAELRNRVYEYAATRQPNKRCSVLPCLALAQLCQQLRTEFRPICLKAAGTIDWMDLPHYIDTFFPMVEGKVQNIAHAPKIIETIISDDCNPGPGCVQIDLLPLVKMDLENNQFSCTFAHVMDPYEEVHHFPNNHEELMEVDTKVLKILFGARDGRWVSDIEAGNVMNIMISPLGFSDGPSVTFFLVHGAPHLIGIDADEITEENADHWETYRESVGFSNNCVSPAPQCQLGTSVSARHLSVSSAPQFTSYI